MTFPGKIVPAMLILLLTGGMLFAFQRTARYVDIETANTQVNERQNEVSQLRAEVNRLVADSTEAENYLQERLSRRARVEEATERMNESIADMLKIMGEMHDAKARMKFQESITESRETRDRLIIANRTLNRQITETRERLQRNREEEFIALSRIDRLEDEIRILREQIARTEEQERRLDATIQLANQSLAEVNRVIGDMGDLRD